MCDSLISIIIPNYNTPEVYLRECVESVLAQDYLGYELLIVDNQSTDGSWEVCQEYAQRDERVKCYQNEQNFGTPAYSRMRGMELARGKFITFIDSDDWVECDYISSLLRAILETEADIVRCHARLEFTDTPPLARRDMGSGKVEVLDSAETALDRLINECNYGVWGNLYSRELLEKVEWPVQKMVYEDAATTARLVPLANKVCLLDETLYHYRQRKTGWVKSGHTAVKVQDGLKLVAKIMSEYGLEVTLPRWNPNETADKYYLANIVLAARAGRRDVFDAYNVYYNTSQLPSVVGELKLSVRVKIRIVRLLGWKGLRFVCAVTGKLVDSNTAPTQTLPGDDVKNDVRLYE